MFITQIKDIQAANLITNYIFRNSVRSVFLLEVFRYKHINDGCVSPVILCDYMNYYVFFPLKLIGNSELWV